MFTRRIVSAPIENRSDPRGWARRMSTSSNIATVMASSSRGIPSSYSLDQSFADEDAETLMQRRWEAEGRCVECGEHTHMIVQRRTLLGMRRRTKRLPLTLTGKVLDGRCLGCNPLDMHYDSPSSRIYKSYVQPLPGSLISNVLSIQDEPTASESTVSDSTASDSMVPQSMMSQSMVSQSMASQSTASQSMSSDSIASDSTVDETCGITKDGPASAGGGGSASEPGTEPGPAGPAESDSDAVSDRPSNVDADILGLSACASANHAHRYLVRVRASSIHRRNRAEIVAAGGVPIVIVALERFGAGSAPVTKQACAALQNLSSEERYAAAVVLHGGVGAVVSSMERHYRDPGVQEMGCAALRNLSAGLSSDNRTAVGMAGGVRVVIGSMRLHPKSAKICDKGVACLGNLCLKHPENRKGVGKEGGVAAIIHAMKEHSRNEGVSEKGMRTLLDISQHPLNLKLIQAEDGIQDFLLQVGMRFPQQCKQSATALYLKLWWDWNCPSLFIECSLQVLYGWKPWP